MYKNNHSGVGVPLREGLGGTRPWSAVAEMKKEILIVALVASALGAGIILWQMGKTGAVSSVANARAPGRASENEPLPRGRSLVPGNRAQEPPPRVSPEGARARGDQPAVQGHPTPSPALAPPTEEVREAADIPSPPGIPLAEAALSPSGEKLLFGSASAGDGVG